MVVTSVIGVIGLSAALEGYFRGPMNALMRVGLAVGALLLIYPEVMTDLAGGIIVLGIAAFNIKSSKANTATSQIKI